MLVSLKTQNCNFFEAALYYLHLGGAFKDEVVNKGNGIRLSYESIEAS